MEEMAAGSAASSSSLKAETTKLTKISDRFYTLEDVVAQELLDLDYPWNHQQVEARISEYSEVSEAINAQLSARVMRNYNDFVQGMQHVQAVETELTLIGVLAKNGRRKLQERDLGLVRGSMYITRQQRKSERLSQVLEMLSEVQGVVQIDTRLRHCINSEDYCEAIKQHALLRNALAQEQFRHFPGLLGLRESLQMHLAVVQQKLSDGLRVAAVSAEFDAERYEEILKAFSMMSPDQALSVGKELLRHVSECIVAVSRQCMLAFAAAPTHESPSEWHRKAQLRDLCRGMDPTRFVACTAQLYEHLCDFLYRHEFLCAWHAYRAQAAAENAEQSLDEAEVGDASFHDVLTGVLAELAASKRSVWDRVQQQVSLVLMTLEFQYPALTEDSFLHILHLTQLLIEEGDAFMATYEMPGAGGMSMQEGRRQWSAPIRNTLKSKAHDYFQSLHYNQWADFKVVHIEQDSWQRLPVPRSYRLLRSERLRVVMPRGQAAAQAQDGAETLQKLRTAENNPFRNYKPEPFLPAVVGGGADGSLGAQASGEGADEIDEHALLQHWIDDSEGAYLDQIGSSMLSNSNRSPVVSSSTVELARVLERYFRMMGAIPQLALDIFQSATQVVEFYVHCVLCLFVQDRQLRTLLEDLDTPLPAPGQANYEQKLQSRHETLLLQRLCPELRKASLRTREFLSSLASLPQGAGATLAGGGVQISNFPKLTSPSSLCGLAERCVGVESVSALLNDLRELRQWLGTLLPRGSGQQEVVETFLDAQEVVAAQLRTFVLMCAARDILEVPDVGRVSLQHFSDTVQGLKWDAKDFSSGSPAQPYVEQQRAQIDEFARRIPCAGGGSIPHATQRTVWRWMQVRIIHECLEVIAKIGRKKSQEATFRLAEDFQKLRDGVQQHFKPTTPEEEPPLLPEAHPLAQTVAWSHLDAYLEAHGLGAVGEGLVWCKRNPCYPMRLLKALLDYLPSGNPKLQKQALTDLEAFFVTYITEEIALTGNRTMV